MLSQFSNYFLLLLYSFSIFPFNNFFLIYVMNRTRWILFFVDWAVMNRTRWILFFVDWAVEGGKGVGGVSSTLERVYRIRRFNIFQVCWFRKLMLHKLIWRLNERKFRSKLAVTLPIKNYCFLLFFEHVCNKRSVSY